MVLGSPTPARCTRHEGGECFAALNECGRRSLYLWAQEHDDVEAELEEERLHDLLLYTATQCETRQHEEAEVLGVACCRVAVRSCRCFDFASVDTVLRSSSSSHLWSEVLRMANTMMALTIIVAPYRRCEV